MNPHSRYKYEQGGQSVSGIDDSWAPPQRPRIRCALCPTFLRQSNNDTLCSVCIRKHEAREILRLQKKEQLDKAVEETGKRLDRYWAKHG